MTAKEVRNLKHKLKTKIDRAGTYIALAQTGDSLGATSAENLDRTKKSREGIIDSLTTLREEISGDCEQFIAEIDLAIEKMKA